ncbi:MAG: RNA polymerase sigma factor [Solirubrobacteraceae bacterium]
MRAHAARIVRPPRVDDVVAHSMLSAWSALLSGPPVDDLRAWLHRIVHNAALSAVVRRGYADGELETAVASPTLTEDLVEGRLAAGAALAAIAALPAALRQALTLTALEGRSARDAAAEMQLSETAMRQLVYRARSRVRAPWAASPASPGR